MLWDSNCSTVLTESDYVDRDYRAEYAAHYSTLLESVEPTSTRLHFFRQKLHTIDDVYTTGSEHYLGFTAIRPLLFVGPGGVRHGQVGRTLLRSNPAPAGKEYVVCSGLHRANIGGAEFELRVAPFLQQDSQVGSCAHAAIWMATQSPIDRYCSRPYSIPEIGEMATRSLSLGRTRPSGGLTIYQTLEALRLMGYSPISFEIEQPEEQSRRADVIKRYDADPSRSPREIIYRYVESGVPVILAVQRVNSPEHHAVTVVGHTYDPPSGLNRIRDGFRWPTELIPFFVCHDDALGPYLHTEIIDGGLRIREHWVGQTVDSFLHNIIVPLPPKVYLTGEAATKKAMDYLSHPGIMSNYKAVAPAKLRSESGADIFSRGCLRTYLRLSNEFKADLRETEIAPSVRETYQQMRMSRFVWVCELSLLEHVDSATEGERKMFGEILFDCTASAFSEAFLAIHLPGMLLVRDLEKKGLFEGWKVKAVPDDRPYKHLVRSSE